MPDLRHCRNCFSQTITLPWVEDSPIVAPCDFCEADGTATWSTKCASGFLAPIAQAYELHPDGLPLHESIQKDWAPFDGLCAETQARLVGDILTHSELETLPASAQVRLRQRPGHDSTELTSTWNAFSHDLRTVNRWFPPQLTEARAILDELVVSHVWIATPGEIFHRARVCLSNEPPLDGMRMKKPPPRLASAGRGNPMGIPHFYGASKQLTAIKECRPVHNCTVSVAQFSLTREATLLDLTPGVPPDPFSLALRSDEGATWEIYVDAATSRAVREHIGAELAKPVRPNESESDYASTQFVCEFAKSKGLDGVRYQSAVDPDEWNVVLFDDRPLTCLDIRRFEVTQLDVEVKEVT